jgi:hypothetical protein
MIIIALARRGGSLEIKYLSLGITQFSENRWIGTKRHGCIANLPITK